VATGLIVVRDDIDGRGPRESASRLARLRYPNLIRHQSGLVKSLLDQCIQYQVTGSRMSFQQQ
jgi:hypothetical protein